MTTLKGPSAILYWCKENTNGYQGVDVADFGQSWKDGLAMCALLHKFHPDKIPFDTLSAEDPKKNYDLAFDVAEQLGVPKLLEAEDMLVEPYPDRQSLIVYLTEVYQHLTGAVPVSGLGSSRSSLELPTITESSSVDSSPRIEINNNTVVEMSASTTSGETPAETTKIESDIQKEPPQVIIPEPVLSRGPSRDRIGHVRSYSQGKMLTEAEQEELFKQREKEAKEALAFEEEMERKKAQWKTQAPVPQANPRKLIRRVTGTVEEWQTKAKKMQEKFGGPDLAPSSPRAGDLHRLASLRDPPRSTTQPTITFKDTITTSVVTTGDEQITEKVEEISKEVDGKETLHITKTEVREQHFNNQIDKPMLLTIEKLSGSPYGSPSSSGNNSGPTSATSSAAPSRSNSAVHSRNNSSEFYMPELSFDRNLTPRSDSWKQEQDVRKRILEEKDREDDEFINKLRLAREDRERKKKESKDQVRPRKTEKIKVEPAEKPPTASIEVKTAPVVVAPVSVPRPAADVAPTVLKKTVVVNHGDVVIVLSRKTVAIVIVVFVVLLYLRFK
jgi:hypothetical protein